MFFGINEPTSECLTEAMTRHKLNFDVWKMVDNVLFDSPGFDLNKRIPSEVCVLRTGVFLSMINIVH